MSKLAAQMHAHAVLVLAAQLSREVEKVEGLRLKEGLRAGLGQSYRKRSMHVQWLHCVLCMLS